MSSWHSKNECEYNAAGCCISALIHYVVEGCKYIVVNHRIIEWFGLEVILKIV